MSILYSQNVKDNIEINLSSISCNKRDCSYNLFEFHDMIVKWGENFICRLVPFKDTGSLVWPNLTQKNQSKFSHHLLTHIQYIFNAETEQVSLVTSGMVRHSYCRNWNSWTIFLAGVLLTCPRYVQLESGQVYVIGQSNYWICCCCEKLVTTWANCGMTFSFCSMEPRPIPLKLAWWEAAQSCLCTRMYSMPVSTTNEVKREFAMKIDPSPNH